MVAPAIPQEYAIDVITVLMKSDICSMKQP